MNNVRAKASDGFTLVEVLVALTILSVALAALLVIFADSFQRVSRVEASTTAASLAQSLLAAAGRDVPLREGDTEGSFANRFRWRMRITRYGDAADQEAWVVRAHRILVEVSWMDGRLERSTTLDTLRLTPKEMPR